MERLLRAWGWWLAGAVTVLLGMFLLSRRLHDPGVADEPEPELG